MKNRRIACLIFVACMFAVAGLCTFLFAQAILNAEAKGVYGNPIREMPVVDKVILIVIIAVLAAIPILLLIRQLFFGGDKEGYKEERIEVTLLHLSVHAVPYGILSLSMLFEYHRIVNGEEAAAAALASIIILFILSEMGLILFSEVREAKQASRSLSSVLTQVNETQVSLDNRLRGMDWLSAHAEITHASTAAPSMVEEIDKLLKEWRRLLGGGQDLRHILLNVLLANYLGEEARDISGDLDSTRLPRGISFPAAWSPKGRLSIFAVNITLYARYLEEAVVALSKAIVNGIAPTRMPCIVAVTTALPTQFWNWPIQPNRLVEYKPVTDYRESQFQAVERGFTRIYRTVLVSTKSSASSTEPFLVPNSEWERQSNWWLVISKATRQPLDRRTVCPFNKDLLVRELAWTDGQSSSLASSAAYWMAEGPDAPPDLDGHSYEPQRVWDFYQRKMHTYVHNNREYRQGRTQILPISEEHFNAPWGSGFSGCPDLMFLGTCSAANSDIWEDDQVDWGVALMSSMSTTTETMFLAVIHDSVYINELWNFLRATEAAKSVAT